MRSKGFWPTGKGGARMQRVASTQIGDAAAGRSTRLVTFDTASLYLCSLDSRCRIAAEGVPGFLLSLLIREDEHVSQIGKLRSNRPLAERLPD